MPLLRTDGIVLQTRDLGEHDRIVVLYTRDHGKLAAVAAGARRIRSRFAGALEPFTWGDAVGFERPGRGLVRLDHFDVRRPFRAVREDLERLGQGARMLEALMRLTADRDLFDAPGDVALGTTNVDYSLALYEEFQSDLRVTGDGTSINQTLEKAGRVDDFFQLTMLMCRDALERRESCGGHFRSEYQTEDGEALRDDENFAHVAAWEWTGDAAAPERHVEPLQFDNVHLAVRSYK